MPTPAGLTPTSGIKVSDWTFKQYRCEKETTFAQVSKVLYGSEKYGKALWLYNREYNVGADNLRQDPPRFAPGQVVIYPQPVDILLTKYAQVIGDPGPQITAGPFIPSTANPSAPPAPAVSVRPPTPLVSGPGNPNTVASAPPGSFIATPTTGEYKSYRVRDGGEHILHIAENTLGKRERFGEIWRLNPSHDMNRPIPGGTVLKLPAEARTP